MIITFAQALRLFSSKEDYESATKKYIKLRGDYYNLKRTYKTMEEDTEADPEEVYKCKAELDKAEREKEQAWNALKDAKFAVLKELEESILQGNKNGRKLNKLEMDKAKRAAQSKLDDWAYEEEKKDRELEDDYDTLRSTVKYTTIKKVTKQYDNLVKKVMILDQDIQDLKNTDPDNKSRINELKSERQEIFGQLDEISERYPDITFKTYNEYTKDDKTKILQNRDAADVDDRLSELVSLIDSDLPMLKDLHRQYWMAKKEDNYSGMNQILSNIRKTKFDIQKNLKDLKRLTKDRPEDDEYRKQYEELSQSFNDYSDVDKENQEANSEDLKIQGSALLDKIERLMSEYKTLIDQKYETDEESEQESIQERLNVLNADVITNKTEQNINYLFKKLSETLGDTYNKSRGLGLRWDQDYNEWLSIRDADDNNYHVKSLSRKQAERQAESLKSRFDDSIKEYKMHKLAYKNYETSENEDAKNAELDKLNEIEHTIDNVILKKLSDLESKSKAIQQIYERAKSDWEYTKKIADTNAANEAIKSLTPEIKELISDIGSMILNYEDELYQAILSKGVDKAKADIGTRKLKKVIDDQITQLEDYDNNLTLPKSLKRQIDKIKINWKEAKDASSIKELKKAIDEQENISSAIKVLLGGTDDDYYRKILEKGVYVVVKEGEGYVTGWTTEYKKIKPLIGSSDRAKWTTSEELAKEFADCFKNGFKSKRFGIGELDIVRNIINNNNKLTELPSATGESSSSGGIGSSSGGYSGGIGSSSDLGLEHVDDDLIG